MRAAHDRMAAARSRLATARPSPKADDRAPWSPQKAAPAPTTIGARTSERRLMSNATCRSTAGPGSTGVRRSACSTGPPPRRPLSTRARSLPACPRAGRVVLLHGRLVGVVGLRRQAHDADEEEHDREDRHGPGQAVEPVAHRREDGECEGELDALHERVREALVELTASLEIVHVSGSSCPAGWPCE